MLSEDAVSRLRVAPGSTVRLADLDPRETFGLAKPDDVDAVLAEATSKLAEYQERLAAEETHALLVVLQAMDAAGKDGAIKHRHVGCQPAGRPASPASRRRPRIELEHDYLWRHVVALPERGKIGIFNRSHYEEVLVVRVHPEILEAQRLPPELEDGRHLAAPLRGDQRLRAAPADNGTAVVKIFLNVSKEEQRRAIPRADRGAREALEVPGRATSRSARTGTPTWRAYEEVLSRHEHGVGAVVRRPGRPEVVRAARRRRDRRRCAPAHRSSTIRRSSRRTAPGPARGEGPARARSVRLRLRQLERAWSPSGAGSERRRAAGGPRVSRCRRARTSTGSSRWPR